MLKNCIKKSIHEMKKKFIFEKFWAICKTFLGFRARHIFAGPTGKIPGTGRPVKYFLCPATRKWRGIMLYPPKFWVSVRPSVRPSVCLSVRPSVGPSVRPSAPTTILVSATPPTVLSQSFWNFTGVLRMVWRYAYCFFRILKLFFITFFPFLT